MNRAHNFSYICYCDALSGTCEEVSQDLELYNRKKGTVVICGRPQILRCSTSKIENKFENNQKQSITIRNKMADPLGLVQIIVNNEALTLS